MLLEVRHSVIITECLTSSIIQAVSEFCLVVLLEVRHSVIQEVSEFCISMKKKMRKIIYLIQGELFCCEFFWSCKNA